MKPSDQKTSTKVKVYVSKKCFLKSPHGILVRIQTNKIQSNYFLKIGLPRGLSFWAVPAATPIESNFTKKRLNGALSQNPFKDVLKLQINCLPCLIVFWKVYTYVAQERYRSLKSVSHWNCQSLRLISNSIFTFLSTEFCPGFAMENYNWADISKKSQLQIKVIFKSKISNRL